MKDNNGRERDCRGRLASYRVGDKIRFFDSVMRVDKVRLHLDCWQYAFKRHPDVGGYDWIYECEISGLAN